MGQTFGTVLEEDEGEEEQEGGRGEGEGRQGDGEVHPSSAPDWHHWNVGADTISHPPDMENSPGLIHC